MIGSANPLKIGEIVLGVSGIENHPVVVIGEATREEMAEQWKEGSDKYPGWFGYIPGWEFHYKVTAE